MKQKFIFLLLFSTFFSLSISAQKIGFGGSLGFAKMTGDFKEQGRFGINYTLEGKYFLTPSFATGLEYGGTALFIDDESNALDIGAYGNTLVLAKAEYFLMPEKKFQPYIGVGLGYSRIQTPEITITSGGQTSTLPSEKKGNFGVAPRLGFMLGNFGFEFNYVIAGKTPNSDLQNTGSSDLKLNYYVIGLKYIYDLEL